jgi:hypothetical protein
MKSTNEERRSLELALEAVLLAAGTSSMLEAQEMLNARVAPTERIRAMAEAGAEA